MSSLALLLLCARIALAAPATGTSVAPEPKEFNDFSEIRPLLDNGRVLFLPVNGTYSVWDDQSKTVIASASAAYNSAIHMAEENGGCLSDAADIMRASTSTAPGDQGDEKPVGEVVNWMPPREKCNYHLCQNPGHVWPCHEYAGCGVCAKRKDGNRCM